MLEHVQRLRTARWETHPTLPGLYTTVITPPLENVSERDAELFVGKIKTFFANEGMAIPGIDLRSREHADGSNYFGITITLSTEQKKQLDAALEKQVAAAQYTEEVMEQWPEKVKIFPTSRRARPEKRNFLEEPPPAADFKTAFLQHKVLKGFLKAEEDEVMIRGVAVKVVGISFPIAKYHCTEEQLISAADTVFANAGVLPPYQPKRAKNGDIMLMVSPDDRAKLVGYAEMLAAKTVKGSQR